MIATTDSISTKRSQKSAFKTTAADGRLQIKANERNVLADDAAVFDEFLGGGVRERSQAEQAGIVAEPAQGFVASRQAWRVSPQMPPIFAITFPLRRSKA